MSQDKTVADDFAKLFDVSSDGPGGIDADSVLTSSVDAGGLESISESDNMKKFNDNMSPHKESAGQLKSLAIDKSEESEENMDEDIDDKSIDDNKLECEDEECEDEGKDGLKEDEEYSDISDSGDENIVSNTDQNSGDKVKMDSLNKTITTHLTNFDWQFENSSPRFENFYKEKKRLVQRITQGELLPFEAYREELRQARVDVSTVDYDFKIILEKMKEVQNWRDRVQEISSRKNMQFFLWKRFIDLIHGYLALVAYEKPAEKFKGVIYQHLGDVEMYLGELESLKDSVEGVLKNLDGASAVLSRQLTMMMGSKESPTVYSTSNPDYQSGAKPWDAEQLPNRKVDDHTKLVVENESVDLSLIKNIKQQEGLGQYDSLNSPQEPEKEEAKCGIVGWKI